MNTIVLIVDDSPDDVEFLRLAMGAEQLPVDIIHRTDADSALVWLSEISRHPNLRLVITDHRGISIGDPTPAIDNIRLAAQKAGVEIIVMSNGLHPDAQAQLKAIGVSEVWDKPLDFEGYVELVHRIYRRIAPSTE